MDTTRTSVSREATPIEDVVRQRRRVPWMAVAVLAVVAVVRLASIVWGLQLPVFELEGDGMPARRDRSE